LTTSDSVHSAQDIASRYQEYAKNNKSIFLTSVRMSATWVLTLVRSDVRATLIRVSLSISLSTFTNSNTYNNDGAAMLSPDRCQQWRNFKRWCAPTI